MTISSECISIIMTVVNIMPAVISFLAVCVSLGALKVARQTLREMKEANIQAQLRTQMTAYTADFNFALQATGNAANFGDIEVYCKFDPVQQRAVDLVLGSLIQIVDTMNASDDPRTKDWTGFIGRFPGSFARGYNARIWSRNSKTLTKIAEEEKKGELRRDEYLAMASRS